MNHTDASTSVRCRQKDVYSEVSGKILSWNRAAATVFGYSAEEALGQPLELIIPERFRDAHRRGIDRVSSGGPSRVIGSTVELAAVRKGGEEFPIELSLATWLLDEERYYTGIIRDISERKEAEQISGAFDFNFTRKASRVRLRLGLATTKRAVEDSGGTLSLESRLGQGTEVRIVLPIASV